MKTESVAIIPARGGSKRIPRKNIRKFLGKPIIQYSIEAALQAKCFDEVMVSTDDSEIAEISKGHGASVPFLRGKETSDDHAGLAEVLLEVIANYERTGRTFEYICCVLPTAPFISSDSILEGCKILKKNPDADAVISIVRFSYPIQRALRIEKSVVSMFWPENYSARSQDLEPAYHDAGQFYWIRCKGFQGHKSLMPERTMYVELPDSMVQDIDSEEDWLAAEVKYRMMREPR